MITVYHFPSYLHQIDNYKMRATGHRCGCATWTSSIMAILLWLWFSRCWLCYRGSCLLLKS